jgi:hypothetical protein
MSTPEVIDMKGSAPVDKATGLPAGRAPLGPAPPRRVRARVPAAPSAPTPLLVPVAGGPRPDATGWRPYTEPWEGVLEHGNTSPYRFPAWTPEAVAFACEHHGKDVAAEIEAGLAKLAASIKADLRAVLGPGLPEDRAQPQNQAVNRSKISRHSRSACPARINSRLSVNFTSWTKLWHRAHSGTVLVPPRLWGTT